MPSVKRGKQAIQNAYGFEFPDDLFAFHDFARSNAKLLAELEIRIDGPLAVLSDVGRELGDDWRFYRDPPEFFTVLLGNVDGLHWGYWFDAPGELRAVVVSYFHSDAYAFSTDGVTLFEALRGELESRQRSEEALKNDDPDEADECERQLETIAKARSIVSKYALAERREVGDDYFDRYIAVKSKPGGRRPVAKTRNEMGIVTSSSAYRSLPGKDFFVEKYDYEPKAAEVGRFVNVAREYAESGKPGAALKLGHDLWAYPEFAAEAVEMLGLAYERLERPVLRSYLDRAVAFRRRCDAERK